MALLMLVTGPLQYNQRMLTQPSFQIFSNLNYHAHLNQSIVLNAMIDIIFYYVLPIGGTGSSYYDISSDCESKRHPSLLAKRCLA